MADLLKILKERQAPKPSTSAVDTAEQDERGIATFSPQIKQAREVARRTRELLATKGWCLWKCITLGGEVIAVVQDESVEGVPEGYPVYTELELEELFKDDVSGVTIRLVHEAKKHGALTSSIKWKGEEDV